jgi:hypothetical protein
MVSLIFWAQRKGKTLGPFATRDEAIEAGKALLPKRRKPRDAYFTGYGNFGPSFDMRFHDDDRR